MAYSSLSLRTQPVLPLFPFKKTKPRQLISKHCTASEYAFFFDTERVQLLWLLQLSLWMNKFRPWTIVYNTFLIYVYFCKTFC